MEGSSAPISSSFFFAFFLSISILRPSIGSDKSCAASYCTRHLHHCFSVLLRCTFHFISRIVQFLSSVWTVAGLCPLRRAAACLVTPASSFDIFLGAAAFNRCRIDKNPKKCKVCSVTQHLFKCVWSVDGVSLKRCVDRVQQTVGRGRQWQTKPAGPLPFASSPRAVEENGGGLQTQTDASRPTPSSAAAWRRRGATDGGNGGESRDGEEQRSGKEGKTEKQKGKCTERKRNKKKRGKREVK